MQFTHLLVAVAAGAVFVTSAGAAKIGDPAQKLAIKDWVKGTPVDVTDGKNIYVVEFWATWCGPCKISIPQLTQMQAKFKDQGVVFVGISDEPLATVKPFVDSMADQMDYIVACDDERKSAMGYMAAYEQAGIPIAFIVGKDKKVQWYGHPMGELVSTLEQVIKGTYDLKAVARRDELRANLSEYNKLSFFGDSGAPTLGRKILTELPNDVSVLTEFAFSIVASLQNKNRDFALANATLDRAEQISGSKDPQVMSVRAIALFESGKEAEGLAMGKEAVSICKDPTKLPIYQNHVRVMELRQQLKSSSPAKAN